MIWNPWKRLKEMAEEKREEIIREWEIAQDGEQ